MKRRWGLRPHTKHHCNGNRSVNVAADGDNKEGDVMDDIINSEEVGEECEDEPDCEEMTMRTQLEHPPNANPSPLRR